MILVWRGSSGSYKIALQYAWLRAACAADTTAGLYSFIAAAPWATTDIRPVTLDSGSPASIAAEGTNLAVYLAKELLNTVW